MSERPSVIARVRAAADWLCLTQDAVGGGGSSAYYAPLRGWADPYPETTGYIIPTLWRCADVCEDAEYGDRAERMGRWLLGIQADEGWFPGGTLAPGDRGQASVFNTGQIVFGLVEAARRTADPAFREAADRAVGWLARTQDDAGGWALGAYRPGHRPSYYAYVAWPLAEYWREFGGEQARVCATKTLEAVLATRTRQGTFTHWAFKPGERAFTHTIAYTIQGMLEAGLTLELRQPYVDAARESAERLMRKFELRRSLAGEYDDRWRGNHAYACLTGHCQMASTWIRLHRETGDPRFLSVAVKALDVVCARQRLEGGAAGTRGAIAGSHPLYGRYMRFRYPNWAAKFFIDALLDLSAALDSLAGPSPGRTE